MGEFSADWLTLREDYDHQARATSLLEKLSSWSAGQHQLKITDLGSGRGSTYRAVAPHLQCPIQWQLTDHDPALLDAMRNEPVTCTTADLQRDLETVTKDADLITASALIDLVSEPWLRRLAGLGKPLYIALTFDGRIAWKPKHQTDPIITQLFCQHQQTDKGFGKALGPLAGPTLKSLLGSNLLEATSDWDFTPQDQTIQRELLTGITNAATEMDAMSNGKQTQTIEQWHQTRKAMIDKDQSSLMIGHVDQLWLG